MDGANWPRVDTAAARTTAFSKITLLKMNRMYREGVSVDTPTVPDVTHGNGSTNCSGNDNGKVEREGVSEGR